MNRNKAIGLLLIVYILLAMVRLTAPFDLDDSDQAKQGLYVLDMVQNGSFALPMVHGVDPATKPPFYNWVAVAISLMYGEVTDLTIRLPSVLCGLGVVIITFLLGTMLFSQNVGLFAGLVLTLNYHFIKVSCLARTDMMLCFFISLALYFFLLAYRQEKRRSVYSILAFITMGLGSITKGPLGLIVPLLIMLVFLFFKHDLKQLRSMRLGWGFTIWLAIMLGWFLAALREGGQVFIDVVIFDEMVNRFLGVGTRAEKTRPFYYLVSHFFGKFLPWSLFVPSALALFWKSRKNEHEGRLLFPVVWLITVLIFFSLSKGKRFDYLIPLYPAASIIVAHFWFSVIEQRVAAQWSKQLRAISISYLSVCAVIVAGMAAFMALPALREAIVRVRPDSSQAIELLLNSVTDRTALFIATLISLAAVSIAGITLGINRRFKPLFVATLVATGLGIPIYFHILSSEALTHDGERKKTFCAEAERIVGTTGKLVFCEAKNSLSFYMSTNTGYLTQDELIGFFDATDDPYVIISQRRLDDMPEHPGFEFVQFAKCVSIEKDGTFFLLGKTDIEMQDAIMPSDGT